MAVVQIEAETLALYLRRRLLLNNVLRTRRSFVLMAASPGEATTTLEGGEMKASIKNVLMVMSAKGQINLAVGW